VRTVSALVLLLALAGPAPAASQVAPEWGEVAARAPEASLGWPELDELLVTRHALSEEGRAALKQLLRARLLDRLARESRFEVTPERLAARWEEIDAEVVAAGQADSLEAYLASQGVDQEVFREFLRLAIVQETLARRALGIPEGRAVNAEQQEMWLDQVMEQRGVEMPAPPWADGVAARCGDLAVSARDFTLFLRTQLDPDAVRDACYQLLLEARVRARMPDIAPQALEQAVEAELDRRRAEVAGDDRYKGLTYEQVLAAQGVRLESLRSDPSVVCAALAHLWVDRGHDEQGLREVYRSERAYFDGLYGEAREVRAVFLRAAVFTNPLNPRSFEEAEAELARLAQGVSSLPDFLRLVGEHSEDATSRDAEGRLGWVPRGDERVPQPIRRAAFSDDGVQLGEGRLVGPLRLPGGVALLWIGARRPAPGWETMREAVRRELRRRFLEECLAREDMVTFLDA
jgi:hypothetical protein